MLYSNWELKRDLYMNSKLRCIVVVRIYIWVVRGFNDFIKGNKVICYLKDRKILYFIRILSIYKVKVFMGDLYFVFILFISRIRRVSIFL